MSSRPREWAPLLGLFSIALTSSEGLLAGPPGPPDITVEAIDVDAGPGHGNPSDPVVWNGQLFFSADDGFACSGVPPGETIGDELGEYGREVFIAGINTGPLLVKNINLQTSANCDGVSGNFHDQAAGLGDALIFRARPLGPNDTGFEPWRTQGSDPTTEIVKDINLFTNDSDPYAFATVLGGSHVGFGATTGFLGTEPWITDGTPEGTFHVGNIAVDDYDSDPYGFTALSSTQFVFIASDDDVLDHELYVSNGSTSTFVKDINPEPNDSSDPQFLTTFVGRNKVVFFAFDETAGQEPWVTDGTPGGTFRLADINPGPASSNDDNDGDNAGFVQLGDQMYFSADDGTTGRELWVTDGTSPGTHLVTEIIPGPGGGYFAEAAVFQGLLYFEAPGRTLWTSDGTALGTSQLIGNIFPGGLNELTAVGDLLYFSSSDELWVTDGTLGGTVSVATFDTRDPQALTPVNSSILAFWAGTSAVGTEMFLAYPTSLASDTTGPDTAISFGPIPVEANQPGALVGTAYETTTGGTDIAEVEYQLDGGPWLSMDPLDGAYDSPIESGLELVSFPTPGTHQACVRGRDALANVGPPLCMDIAVFGADTVSPPPPTVDVVPNPVMTDTVATLTITASDVTTGNNQIAFIEYQIDGGNWIGMSALDGFYDEPTESARELIVFDEGGVFQVCGRALDDANNLSGPTCIDVEVIAPDPTVRLRAIEVNQVIQNWKNEIPLYRKKSTTVRIFFEKIDPQAANWANGLLHGTRNGQPLSGSPLNAPARATAGDDATAFSLADGGDCNSSADDSMDSYRADLTNSLDFFLPDDWIGQGGTVELEFELTVPVDGVLECAEPDGDPNCKVGVTFEPKAVPLMEFFAIAYDRSHVFELSVSGTGGEYTITSAGRESDPIPYNAPSSTVRDAAKDVFNADRKRVQVLRDGCIGSRTYTITVLRGEEESLQVDDSQLTGGSASVSTIQTGGPTIQPTENDMREQVWRVTDVFPIDRIDSSFRDINAFNKAPGLGKVNKRLTEISVVDRVLDFLGLGHEGVTGFGYLLGIGPKGGGLAWTATGVSSSYASSTEDPTASGYARNRGGHEAAHVYGRPHAVNEFRFNQPPPNEIDTIGICGAVGELAAEFHPNIEDTGVANFRADDQAADGTTWPTIGSLSVGFDDEVWGFSPRAFANGLEFEDLAVIDPRLSAALMSYCAPGEGHGRWVSAYAYDKLRDRLGSGSGAQPRDDSGILAFADYMLVFGEIDPESSEVTLDPIVTVNGVDPGFQPGTVHVAIHDGLGGEIASQDVLLMEDGIQPGNTDDPEGELLPATFVAAIPLPDGSSPVAVVVEIDSQEVARIDASSTPPTVQIDSPTLSTVASGTIPLAWTADDLDGDPLTASVLLSIDGGLSWKTMMTEHEGSTYDFPVRFLEGSTQAQVRVLVTDGFHTTEATSDLFELDAGYPTVGIEIPVNGIAVPADGILHLRGDGWDPEDGVLEGASLVWIADADGPAPFQFAIGAAVDQPASQLTTGCHLITLAATDSDGNTATDSIEVDIGETGCLGLFFADGFESGDAGSWSDSVP